MALNGAVFHGVGETFDYNRTLNKWDTGTLAKVYVGLEPSTPLNLHDDLVCTNLI